MNGHLSEDRIDACMIGAGTAEEHRHLANCPACAARLEGVAAPLALFRETLHEPMQIRFAERRAPARGWQIALAASAAACLLAVAAPVYRQVRDRPRAESARATNLPAPHAPPASSAVAGTEQEDDALLRRVESEVSRSVPRPMQPLESLMVSDSTNQVNDTERSQ